MTTPANPTPEPTLLTDAAKFFLYFEHNSRDWNVRGQGEFRKGDVVPAELSADLERQLSDTRRRLAEVEKERDDFEKCRNTLCSMCAAAVMAGGFEGECLNCEVDELRKGNTALRNAADGMRAEIEAQPHALGCNVNAIYFSEVRQLEQRKRGCTCWKRGALAAYAALISEGAGKPTE